MAYERPSVDDFKAYFVRDFPYAADNEGLEFVQDADINKALTKTGMLLSEALATDQEFFTTIYLYLAAHNLVMDLRASSQGVGSQANWLQSGKAVGGVSESFSIPERILKNPSFSLYSRTGYGMEFLNFVYPRLVGAVYFGPGRTLP